MPKFIVYLILLFSSISPLAAQYYPLPFPSRPRPRPLLPKAPKLIGIGAYIDIGSQGNYAPGNFSVYSANLGIYAEWTPHILQPGLDLRHGGASEGVHGVLVGPRAAVTLSILHPYAEALFGRTHIETYSGQNGYAQRNGITSELVLGIEGELSPHLRWRVFEFTQGAFTGIPGSNPRSYTTGFLLHL